MHKKMLLDVDGGLEAPRSPRAHALDSGLWTTRSKSSQEVLKPRRKTRETGLEK